jgi:hypothetical protein
MLKCWRVEVMRHKPSCTGLDNYAQMKPTWEELVEISIHLATKYLDKPHTDDLEFWNNSITLALLLQYIELAHVMKHGDMGSVEATFTLDLGLQKCSETQICHIPYKAYA